MTEYAAMLTQLIAERTGDEWDLDIYPNEATHQIEIFSGRVIEYTHGDEPPEDFDPDTQLWIKVKKKEHN